MQRLKGVEQHGYFAPFFSDTSYRSYNRFEHSVGVFILLREFEASFEEQIAGLIHDVSHTVFSHVGDYVFGSEIDHDFQDRQHQKFIKNSEIPEILEKYNTDYQHLLEEEKFPLKEKELPDLCADRIDYSLREMKVAQKADLKKINQFLDNLKIVDNLWVFKSESLAREFALLYLEMNNEIWAGFESGVMLKTMGELLKYALDKNVISRKDLFTTEAEVWDKIRPAAQKDPVLTQLLEKADNQVKYIAAGPNDYDLYSQIKSRVVDPLIFQEGGLRRLSELDPDFLELKDRYSKPKEYYIKFLSS